EASPRSSLQGPEEIDPIELSRHAQEKASAVTAHTTLEGQSSGVDSRFKCRPHPRIRYSAEDRCARGDATPFVRRHLERGDRELATLVEFGRGRSPFLVQRKTRGYPDWFQPDRSREDPRRH